jgi:hypothetical protein
MMNESALHHESSVHFQAAANHSYTMLRQGEYEQSMAIQLDVAEVRERILGANHPSTLTSKSNLAASCTHMG